MKDISITIRPAQVRIDTMLISRTEGKLFRIGDRVTVAESRSPRMQARITGLTERPDGQVEITFVED
jgi:hypothetical protein